MRAVARAAYLARSSWRAKRGRFPLFERDAFLASGTMQAMDDERARRRGRARHPQRAADLDRAHRHDQPLCGQCQFRDRADLCHSYTRKVLQKDGSRTEEEVEDYAVQMWRADARRCALARPCRQRADAGPDGPCEDAGRGAEMGRQQHLQDHQLPGEDISFDAFKDVYMQAWDMGCKGCTTYRPMT